MGIRIGIDVGGTFTDTVLINGTKVIKAGKIPTIQEDMLTTVLTALDYLEILPISPIDYITVSTTIVTNAILQNNFPDVKLILFPGSGMKLSSLHWPVPYQTLSGELDFRGREVISPKKEEWSELAESIRHGSDNPLVAIVSKFSHRNNIFEEQLRTYLENEISNISIAIGSQWGQTNFFRRSLTTYLNIANRDLFLKFASDLKKAIIKRGYRAPIRVLKADGGVLPLEKFRPVESIYSGPAASVLGALAQNNQEDSYIVVDIGGTTTDIGLVLSGSPLISSRGATIGPFLSNIRSLAVRAIPIGGDSAIIRENGEIKLASYRLGPAYCIGGSSPTPTDAMRYLSLTDYGSYSKAEEALASLLPEDKQDISFIRKVAELIVEKMVEQISASIEQLLQEWKTEPAYKVWEVIHHNENIRFHIQLSGGGAPGIALELEKKMNMKTILSELSAVSNAIGAAMAKPTFSWTLHLDTYLRRYRIEETGEQGIWNGPKKPHQEVEQFLREIAQKEAKIMEIESDHLHKEPFDYFPLVEGYQTVGQIIKGSMHIPPGVIGRIEK